MKINLKLLSIFLLICSAHTTAREVEGTQISESLEFGNQKLTLNGAGLREKFVFDVYAVGLYLTSTTSNATNIINQDEAMAIKLHMLRSVSGQDMADAIFEGFEKILGGDTSSLTKEINDFLEIFGDEAVNKHIYQLLYVPQQGVKVFINNKLIKTIEGIEFKRALFAIWLGEKPAQKSLKKELLGSS